MKNDVQHVFLVGAKSLGAYGGYETFVNKLTEYHQNDENIQYHVACKANGDGHMDETQVEGVTILSDKEFVYHNARCFKIQTPNIGPAQAIYYDLAALQACCTYIEENKIPHPIIYVMACRIGPFAGYFYRRIHKLGGKVYLNPDGHEWKRAKWSAPIRAYWKISEKMMVKHSDLVICDSINIEKYIHENYDGKGRKHTDPNTTYIAYGAETRKSKLEDDDPKLLNWYKEKGLSPKSYYLVVGRFVPENNYETMIREFIASNTKRDFAIITNVNDKFLDELEQKLHFRKDPRIKFVGTVYDQELLMKIRENAYAYFHGHEVGGTNPSLLEALGSTDLNLLFDVGFNREVARETALYWTKKAGDLASLIDSADAMEPAQIADLSQKAAERIRDAYSWDFIARRYYDVFEKGQRALTKDKIRIAMLGHKRIPSREGGVEVVVSEISTRMAALGHEVTCYNRGGHHVSGKEFDIKAGDVYKGVRIKTVPTLDKKGFAAFTSSFCAAVCAAFGKYDVVHFHAEGPCAMMWIPKLFGKRCIATIHGLDWKSEKWKGGFGSKYIHLGEKTAVKYADVIISLSSGMRGYFMDTYSRTTAVVPNGVNMPVHQEPKLIQEKFGLKKDDYILYLGRIVPGKGVEYLIDAYQSLNTAKKLVIAGGVSDSYEYMASLKEKAGANDRIIFTGFVTGRLLDELYGNAYIYTLPSDHEGMPLSLLEAMSYGNCCVTADISECTDVVEDKAVAFKKSSVSDLRQKLQLLCDDPQLVAHYKADASGFICQKYSWDDVVEKTLELYRGEKA